MASNVKIVIVGDGSVGKTSLCNVFVNQSFPTNHDATVFENFSQELYVCGQV
jgi:GTPase SAR1 family protein